MRKQQIIVALCILILGAVALYGRLQPDNGLLKFRVKDDRAYGYGDTTAMSVHMVREFLNDNPDVKMLVLKKMPGTRDADMNIRIAREIRKRGLKTHLDSNSFIASGAVDLFLAGTERTMECGAMIGVHSWGLTGDRTGQISPRTIGIDRRQKFHEDFLKDMDIDPSFYVFTREAAPPDDLYFLTADDIARFGLLTENECRN